MLCLCCFIAAAFLYDLSGVGKIIIASAALFLALVCFVLSKVLKSKTIKRRLSIGMIALLFTFLSLCESFVYFNLYVVDFEQYTDKTCKIECEIFDEDQSNGFDLAYVKLISINGERKFGTSVVHFEYNENIGRGRKIKVNAKGVDLDTLAYYGGKEQLLSEGVSSAFSVENYDDAELEVLSEDKNLYIVLTDFACDLSAKLSKGVGGEEGKFSAAILFGRRDLLSQTTVRDFARSGISHILALSGLHMALIAGLIEFVLRKFYVPKVARCFIILPFMLFYTMMTGFAMSAIRAAVMLTIFYICFIFSRPSDSLTTVALAGFLIVFLMPSSIRSCGFIMSLAATFGIIVVSPYLSAFLKNRRPDTKVKTLMKKIGRFAVTSIVISIAANIAVLYYTWSMFGQISLATPIANLLITPVISIQLASAALYLLLGWIPFVGTVLIWIQKIVGDYIISTAGFFSDIKGVCVSLKYGFVGIIVSALLISTAVLLILKLRHKWFVAAPLTLSVVAFCICLAVTFSAGKNSVVSEYLKYNEREMFVMTQNGDAVICDISDGNYSNLYNAYQVAHDNGATEIEVLVLTHYHNKHGASIDRLCKQQKVRNIWLPEPQNEDQYYTMTSIVKTAEKNGVNLVIYENDEDMRVFYDGVLNIYPLKTLKRSAQPAMAFEFTYGDDKLIYVGSSAMETALSNRINHNLSDADFVIFGTHGPNPKQTYDIDAAKNAETMIFAERELFDLAQASVDVDFCGEIVYDCRYFRFEMSK